MKKKILLLLTFITLFYSIDALFLDFHFSYKIPQKNPFQEEEPTEDPKVELSFGGGLISGYVKMKDTLVEINETEIPSDAYPEKTIDKLERALISKQISLTINVFLLILSITTLIGIFYNTWFSIFSGRTLFFVSTIVALFYIGRSSFHMQFIPIYGFIAFLFNIINFIFFIWAFRYLGVFFENYEPTYNSLYIASINDEDNNSGKVELFYKKKKAPKFKSKIANLLFDNFISKIILFVITNKIIRHFIYIIIAGIILGNLVYIPLFSLQKHYASEFGLLIFTGIFLLTLFYIRNYYKIGKDETAGLTQNLMISVAFLQFRFLRNLTMFLLTTVGVIIFVTTLFLILNWNSSILVDLKVIERTINL